MVHLHKLAVPWVVKQFSTPLEPEDPLPSSHIPCVPFLSHIDLIDTLSSYSFRIHLNVILHLCLGLPIVLLLCHVFFYLKSLALSCFLCLTSWMHIYFSTCQLHKSVENTTSQKRRGISPVGIMKICCKITVTWWKHDVTMSIKLGHWLCP